MAYTSLPGMGAAWPSVLSTFSFSSSYLGYTALPSVADAKVAQSGFAWWPDGSTNTKTIAHVWWSCAGRTIAATTQWRVSIQGVSLVAGPPMQPNGVIAGSFVSTAGQLPTNNAYNRNTLSSSVSVTRGQLISVVLDWAVFAATSNITVQFTSPVSPDRNGLATVALFNATWQNQTNIPNVLLEFTDGTYGTLFGTVPVITMQSRGFNSSSTGSGGLTTGNERGLEFTPTVSFVADGVIIDAYLQGLGTPAYDVVVYEDTTPLVTVVGDNNVFQAAGTDPMKTWTAFPQQIEFKKNTLYRVMVKALTTNQVFLRTITIATADARSMFHGTTAVGNSRTGTGAFGVGSTTELPVMSFTLSSLQGGSGVPTLLRRNQVD